MARKPLLLQSEFPYHVTARSNNREWFYLPSPLIWDICGYLFNLVKKMYEADILEFVLMSNHFHLLIQTPKENLDRIMNYFMREFSKAVGTKSGRTNHIFGGRYKGSLIQEPLYFAHVYKYIFRNPIEAGIIQRVEDFSFSTLKREWNKPLRFEVKPILLHPLSENIPKKLSERLEWMNTKYTHEQYELIRRSIKKTIFHFPTHRRHQSLIESLKLGNDQK